MVSPCLNHNAGLANRRGFTGHFLYADAPLGVEGDKAYIESPPIDILENQCLEFYLYLRLNPNGTEDTFR